MIKQNTKTIYTYYSKYNKNLVDLIYEISMSHTKMIFIKKWGPYLNGRNKIVLNEEERNLFNRQAYDFENKLIEAQNLKNKGYTLKQIKAYFKGEATIQAPKRKKSIYDYFLESERLYVTQAIEWYKNYKDAYWTVIIKSYGKFYNCYKTGSLTKTEELLLDYIIGSDLPEKVNLLKVGYVPINQQGKKRKKSFFAYGEKRELLGKIERWKQTKPEYICLIEKLYGSNYDNLDNYVGLTEEETKTWNSIVRELYFMKKNKQVKKIHTDTIYPKMDSFALEKSLSYLDFLILSTRSKRQDLSDEALANYLIITMEQLDSCYIRNLHLFESSIPEMIKRLIKRNKNNIERILKESYLKYFLPYLTIEEQIYLQAKLHSYNNSNLEL